MSPPEPPDQPSDDSGGDHGDEPPQTGQSPPAQDTTSEQGMNSHSQQTASDQGAPPTSDSHTDDSPSLAATIGITVLGFLLVIVLVGANTAIAADRTVLDSEHVVETFDDEAVFAEFTEQFRENVASKLSNATATTTLPPGVDIEGFDSQTVAEESVTESHVSDEMGDNIETMYAFLHGERDDAPFIIDLRPVKDSIDDSLAESITIDTPALVGQTREDTDEEQVAALEADEQRFEEAQVDVSDEQREQRKAAIEADIREQGYSENVTEALIALQFTVVDGLTGELGFEAYNEQREEDERALAEALAAESLADIDDELDLSGEDGDPSEGLSGPATMVQWITTFTWLLPLIAVVLVGLIALVSRSVERTAATTGWALLITGLVGVLVGIVLRSVTIGLVESLVFGGGSSDPGPFVSGFLAVIESFFATMGTQSVVLTLAGVALVALAMADRRGHLAGVYRRIGVGETQSSETGSDGRAGEGHPADRPDEQSGTSKEADGDGDGAQTETESTQPEEPRE